MLLPDTPASGTTFWSPDGREVVVLGVENRLIAIDVERGGRRIVAELDRDAGPLRGADWFGQTILLGTRNTIWLQDPSGRTARREVTTLVAPGEVWHGWPMLLPDGRRFFYTVGLANGTTEARIGSLDGDPPIHVALPAGSSRVRFDHRGFVVYGQNRSLIAQRVDIATGALQGSPIRLAPEVFQNPTTGWISADVSRNGVLAWRAPGIDDVQFELVDREGRTVGVVGQPDAFTNFDVSSDGRIVTTRRRGEAASTLFLIDPAKSLTTPISDGSNAEPISDPTWSPDGEQIAYRRGGHLVVRNVFGGDERELTGWAAYPDSWSRDGRYLAIGRPQPGDSYELWALSMDGRREELPLVQGLMLADEPRFSPDGRWVVFHAAVEGLPQVFAIPFPPTGERFQLSTEGGVQPRFRADGRELYYLSSDGQVMVVAMPDGNPTKAQSPRPLFGLRLDPSPAFDQFAAMSDGERFVVRRPLRAGGADAAPVHVLVNWTETLPPAGAR
jgi:Tol biopolymer transport system component